MKTLPCYIIIASFSSIVLLAAVAALGVALPYLDIVAHLAGYAAAVGLLALASTDTPRRSARYAAHLAEMEAGRKPATARRAAITDHALAAFGVSNDPATVSMM
jgi:hypothetical protein